MIDKVTDYLVLGLYVAVLYVLVRPASKAPAAVSGIFNTMTQLATLATDF